MARVDIHFITADEDVISHATGNEGRDALIVAFDNGRRFRLTCDGRLMEWIDTSQWEEVKEVG